MNSFFSSRKVFYEITGGGFSGNLVAFHMEEPFTRLGTDAALQFAALQFTALNLLWFIHKTFRGVEDGTVCGPVKSFNTKDPSGDCAFCAVAAMLEQKRAFLKLTKFGA